MARPMPREAPVTIAFLPVRWIAPGAGAVARASLSVTAPSGSIVRPGQVTSDHVVRDRDVPAYRVGVRADGIRLLHQVYGGLPFDAGKGDREVDLQPVPHATRGPAYPELGGHRGAGHVGPGLAGDQGERAVEAGREPGREQLLGVGALAGTAELAGNGDGDVQPPVVGGGPPLPASLGGGGGGGQNLVERHRRAVLRRG